MLASLTWSIRRGKKEERGDGIAKTKNENLGYANFSSTLFSQVQPSNLFWASSTPSKLKTLQLVPAVSELICAELMYLQYLDAKKLIYMYINSTGTTRADGETVGFETEATAIYDTMNFVANDIATVGVGVAIGQACMLLSAGKKGKRFMLPHATAMLQQPRLPPTGQRQAVEVEIRWREVLAQKKSFLKILNKTTGHSVEKLDADLQRPLYMQPKDAIEYGVIDGIVEPQKSIVGEDVANRGSGAAVQNDRGPPPGAPTRGARQG